jgi:hypothetical protein
LAWAASRLAASPISPSAAEPSAWAQISAFDRGVSADDVEPHAASVTSDSVTVTTRIARITRHYR